MLHDELKELNDRFPVPSDEKFTKRTDSLVRIATFYEAKAQEAPQRQAALFIMFVSTLHYAVTIIKMYRALTIRLHELIEEHEDEAQE